MKVEFNVLQRARADLLGILERRSRNPLDALATAQVFLADIEMQFLSNDGPPPHAEILPRDPEGWWWMYIQGVWLGFTSYDKRKGMFLGVVRTITLVEVRSRRPGVASPPA